MQKLKNMHDPNLAKSIVEIATEKGAQYAKSIKTNQIRNFYSQVEALKQKVKMDSLPTTEEEEEIKDKEQKQYTNELVMLKPRLAYAAGRQSAVKPFYDDISQVIDYVLESTGTHRAKALENFFLLVESIVAYHKFYGGKDK